METLQKALGAILSIVMVATTAMAAGAALMLFALVLVGLVDWTSGQQFAGVGSSRGVAEQPSSEQEEAPRPFN